MKTIKFRNGNSITVIDDNSLDTHRSKRKSFDMMKWIMGDVYKSLHWYQKLIIWITYHVPDKRYLKQ